MEIKNVLPSKQWTAHGQPTTPSASSSTVTDNSSKSARRQLAPLTVFLLASRGSSRAKSFIPHVALPQQSFYYISELSGILVAKCLPCAPLYKIYISSSNYLAHNKILFRATLDLLPTPPSYHTQNRSWLFMFRTSSSIADGDPPHIT